LAMRIARITTQIQPDKFCPICDHHVCQAGGAVEQRKLGGGAPLSECE
jgi:hypothetical protein